MAESEACGMLDAFAETGGVVDSAANYPINGSPVDFGRSSAILSKWLRSTKPKGLSVFYKVGALDNMGGPETALSMSDILLTAELARGKFAEWLGGIAVHWDNRQDLSEISETVEAIRYLTGQGLEVGFSGVRRPDLYRQAAPDLASKWWIQVKENITTSASRDRYERHFPDARYIAYGINMGGVKGPTREDRSSLALRGLDVPGITRDLVRFVEQPPKSLFPAPRTLNQLAMMRAWAHPDLDGVVIGPRDQRQLRDSLSFWCALDAEADPQAVWRLTRNLEALD